MSRLVQVGVSHASAPLRWRERLAIGADAVGPVAAALIGSGTVQEAFVVSTCSRVEAYAVTAGPLRVAPDLPARLAHSSGRPFDAVGDMVEVRHDADAARHLLRTAAGLQSPILGEPEILGQLRRAHASASDSGAAGPVLDQLVARAMRTGRRVRAETGLGSGAASLTSTALALARGLAGVGRGRALVIGRTRTARAVADRLRDDGWAVSAGAAPRAALGIDAFDVVVACTGTGAAIGRETLSAGAGARATPLLVVDLSVPRDVDPLVRELPGVLLYDVDDLAVAGRHTAVARSTHIPAAEAIVEDELGRFGDWLATRTLVPTIKALRDQQRRAVTAVLGELPDELLERLVTRLLHAPTARLRQAAVAGAGERWALAARELFDVGNERSRRAA